MLVDTRRGAAAAAADCWGVDNVSFEVADFFLRFFLPSPLPM